MNRNVSTSSIKNMSSEKADGLQESILRAIYSDTMGSTSVNGTRDEDELDVEVCAVFDEHKENCRPPLPHIIEPPSPSPSSSCQTPNPADLSRTPSQLSLYTSRMSVYEHDSMFKVPSLRPSASNASSISGEKRTRSAVLDVLPFAWMKWLRACTDGDVATAKKLLDEDPSLVNFSAPYTDRLCAVHLAARGGHFSLLQILNKTGHMNINARTSMGYTALHLAAKCGNNDMVNVLRDMGADPELMDVLGYTYEDYAKRSKRTKERVENRVIIRANSGVGLTMRPPSLHSKRSARSASGTMSSRGRTIKDKVLNLFHLPAGPSVT